MSEFPGNSRSERKDVEITEEESVEELRAERVVFDGVIRREKSIGSKLADLLGGVFGGLMSDVLIPALKDTARDFVHQGIDRALYRDDEPRSSSRRSRSSSSSRDVRTSVHTPYDRVSRERDAPRRRGRHERYEPINLEEVILKSHVAAEAVIDEMYEVMRKYKVVTIADLNHILGQDEATASTDHNWGWYDLRGIRQRRIKEGYLLVFPDTEDLH